MQVKAYLRFIMYRRVNPRSRILPVQAINAGRRRVKKYNVIMRLQLY